MRNESKEEVEVVLENPQVFFNCFRQLKLACKLDEWKENVSQGRITRAYSIDNNTYITGLIWVWPMYRHPSKQECKPVPLQKTLVPAWPFQMLSLTKIQASCFSVYSIDVYLHCVWGQNALAADSSELSTWPRPPQSEMYRTDPTKKASGRSDQEPWPAEM